MEKETFIIDYEAIKKEFDKPFKWRMPNTNIIYSGIELAEKLKKMFDEAKIT